MKALTQPEWEEREAKLYGQTREETPSPYHTVSRVCEEEGKQEGACLGWLVLPTQGCVLVRSLSR